MKSDERKAYGLLAEFKEASELLDAVRETKAAGYRHLDAFSPFPLEGLSEALGLARDRVPLITLIGGLVGGFTGYMMQWYANAIDYPLNIAGRPLNSWPAFIPVTFELTILGASLSAAIGMLWLNRLPELYHPVFAGDDFARASKDRFFLCVQASDPKFEAAVTRSFLERLNPLAVSEIRDER